MHPAVLIALATAAGVPVGLWLRRDLATLRYRKGDELALPQPGARRWVTWTSIVTLGSLAAVASLSGNSLPYLPLLPLAIAGPWLAAVDFDVLRIPDRALAPTVAATLLAAAGVAAVAHDWRGLMVPMASCLVAGCVFASIHFATKGGVGFGDGKLAATIGLAVGPLGSGAVWLSVLSGSVAALMWAKTARRMAPIAYGPWLLCGAWIAALTNALTP
ncbi:MAG: prepilin peptidase [Actinobacteria bacterium]|nr:prepilin peptidase [Actinomycetota bacterium]